VPRLLPSLLALSIACGASQSPARGATHARLTVSAVLDPSTGRVTETLNYEGAPDPFAVAAHPRLRLRCADESTCRVQMSRLPPEMGSDLLIWAIRGDARLIGEGSFDTADVEMHDVPDRLGHDWVEMSARRIVPRPLSFDDSAMTITMTWSVSGESAVTWPSERYDGPIESLPLVVFATPALAREDVACTSGHDAIALAYDARAPGRDRARELASVACDGLDAMRARWGEPEGEGPFHLWLPPRRGTGYYDSPRLSVVPAYYGLGTLAASEVLGHEETPTERTYTEMAALHEVAHAWFAGAPSPAFPQLHEGLASYAAVATLMTTRLGSPEIPCLLPDAATHLEGPADDYALGGIYLRCVETERGAVAIDAFVRAVRAAQPLDEAALRAIAQRELGDFGTAWLDASARLASSR